MSVNIGPKIGIDGEKEYRQQVNNLITQAKTFSSEMRELESSFDKSTSAMEKNRKKTELLNKQVKNQKKLVEDLEKGLSEAKETFGDNATQTQKWEQALNNAKTELNKLNNELKNMPSKMTLAGDKMQSIGRTMQTIGDGMTKYISVPLAAVGAASVKMAMDAETSFAKVNTIIDHSVLNYDELTTAVIAASNETGVAVVDFNEALYSAVSAGIDTGNAIQFTTDAVKLAKGGFTDTGKAVDVLTTIMNSYGLSADEATNISDKLITTQNEGKTTVDELAGSLGRVIPTAKNANVDFDNVASALAVMTKHGISTNEATTYLNAMLGELNKTGSATDKILREQTGMSFKELMDAGVPLTDVLQILDQAAQNDGKSLSDLFSQQTAGKAALTIMSGAGEEFNIVLEKMAESSGATAEAFDTMSNTSAAKFQKSLNEVKNIGIEIGDSLLDVAKPALETISGVVKTAANRFSSLTDNQQATLVKLGLFATAAGPAVSAIGTVTEAVGGVIGALGSIPGAAEMLGAVGGPAALAVGAVLAVKIGIDASKEAAIASCDGLKESMEHTAEAAGALKESVSGVQETIEATNATVAEINKKSNTAEALIDELYKLEAQSNKTAAEQERMKSIVGALNSLYPDLGLEIDGTTGKLNKSKEGVIEYVEEAKNLALVEAYTKGVQEAYGKLAQAEIDMIDAKKAQAEALDAYTRAYHDWYTAYEQTPLDLSGQHINTAETEKLWTATEAARVNLENMNGTVRASEKAIDDATASTVEWEGKLNELTGTTGETTTATEGNKTATDDYAESADDATESAEDLAEAVDESGKVMSNITSGAGKVASANKDMSDQIKKSLEEARAAYKKMAEDASNSIQTQIGLFDKFEKKDDVTIESLKANAESRRQAIQNYGENLQKLIQWAEESGSDSAKAYVAAIAEMGMGAATEVEVLANSADEDLRFLADQNYEAVVTADFTGEQAAYAMNGFRTAEEAEWEKHGKTAGGKISKGISEGVSSSTAVQAVQSAAATVSKMFSDNTSAKVKYNGYVDVEKTAKDASGFFSSLTHGTVNVDKHTGAAATAKDAKSRFNQYAAGATVDVSKHTGAAATAKDAKSRFNQYATGATVGISQHSGAAATARDAKSRFNTYASGATIGVTGYTGAATQGKAAKKTFKSNADTSIAITGVTGAAKAGRDAAAAIKRAAGTVNIPVAVPMANGGFVNGPQYTLVGEAGPEVVIPLSASRRDRAAELYQQAGEILGMAARQNEAPTADLPSHEHPNTSALLTARAFGLDLTELYETVANAAMAGLEAANIKIYWDNREAGRIMRDMGVQFAS